jgi:transcriptional regulator with XRE-family HTH domain
MDISAMRHAAGLTQTQLAEELGVPQTVVSRLERQSEWKLSTLVEYMQGLDAEVRLTVSLPNGGGVVYVLVNGDFVVARDFVGDSACTE